MIRHLLLNRFWFLGGSFSVLGWLSYFNALTLSEYLDIRPLTNLSLIVAVIGGSLWFKEQLVRKEYLSVLLILVGALVLSTQLAEAKSLIVNLEFLTGFLIVLTVLFLINIVIGFATKQQRIAEVTIPLAAGISYGVAEVFTNLLAVQFALDPANGVVDQLTIFIASTIFFLIAALNILGFLIKQLALYKGRATIVIPISTGLALFLSILLAILVFDDQIIRANSFGLLLLARPLGITLIILGTILLGTLSQKRPQPRLVLP